MATRAVPVVAVIFAVIATLLCVGSAAPESSTTEPIECPAGETPKCEINTRFRTQVEKYPHPNSCNWYFLCSNGVAYCVKCADGLYYNPGTERCDTAVPEGCKETSEVPTEPPTTIPTVQPTIQPTEPPTIQPTEPPTTAPPEECPGNGHHPSVPQCPVCECDGTTFKHPYNCEWYYECDHNVPILKHCDGGFHWNDKLNVCDYPCLAGCNSNSSTPEPTPEPTHAPAITTHFPPTEGPPSVCPSVSPEPECPEHDPALAVFFPHPTSCSYYYECSNGKPNCMPCPPGLYFNININDCDYPEDSGCTAGP